VFGRLGFRGVAFFEVRSDFRFGEMLYAVAVIVIGRLLLSLTAAGKARASQNALRHGCESLALWAGGYAEEIEVLARTMAGNDVSGGRFAQARRIAAAQLDLARVRQMKLDLQTAANFGSDGLDRTVCASPDWNLLVPISKLERYEQRARAPAAAGYS